MAEADVGLALSNADSGLERCFDVNVPLAIKSLDSRHATKHLAAFAKVDQPEAAGDKVLTAWCHTLKHAGGAPLVQVLARLDRRKRTLATEQEYDGLVQYLGKHVDRMKYPEYLKRGWQIATGVMESACKTVVNQRLCLCGMRWGEDGSDAVAHLRAL